MIRVSALAWLLVLALLGIGLFQVKYEVQAREVELRKVRKQIEANYAAIRVLEAEWSYLNDLPRLTDLARRHTDLAPITPSQIRDLSEVPNRAPEMQLPAPSNGPTDEAPPALLVGDAGAQSEPAPLFTQDDVIDAILADMRSDDSSSHDVVPSIPLDGGAE